MGWFSYKDTDLALSEASLDDLNKLLEQINKQYQDAFKRNISIDEFGALLQVALGAADDTFFDGFETEQVIDVKIKTARKKRKQPFSEGDIFAIPLNCGGYSYGRVIHLTEVKSYMIVEIFSYYSETRHFTPGVVDRSRLCPPFVELQHLLQDWSWQVVGHSTKNLETRIDQLDFIIGRPDDYYLISGDKLHTFPKDRPVSNKEAQNYGTMEFQTAGGHANGIEKLLRKKKVLQ